MDSILFLDSSQATAGLNREKLTCFVNLNLANLIHLTVKKAEVLIQFLT